MGQPFVLRDWQRWLIWKTYGPLAPDGTRQIRRALWSMARKNGKTALAAALVLVHLVGPEAVRNGEVLSAASDREQAALIHKMASQMIDLDSELRNMCVSLGTKKRITCAELGTVYQALSADAQSNHGGNPCFCIYDELAQAKNRELYDVLTTAFGAQEEGLFLAISTQSADPESVMSEMADDAINLSNGMLDDPYFFGHVFCVPDDDEDAKDEDKIDIFDPEVWKLANPALGDFRLLKDLDALAYKAKRSPAAEASFRNLYLNQRVDGLQAFVNSRDWRACAGHVPDAELADRDKWDCYLGIDLSGKTDLTAIVAVFVPKDETDMRRPVRLWAWTPEHDLIERQRKDGARYIEWINQGLLTKIPGRTIEYDVVAKKFVELCARYNVRSAAFDSWRIDDFKREVERLDPKILELLVKHGQGFKDMSPSIERLEGYIISHELQHSGNKLLTYSISNVKVLRDTSENRRFDKRRQTRRIDPAVALAMACGAMSQPQEVQGPSIYEERGLLVVGG